MYTMEGRIRYSETDSNGRLTLGGLIDYFQDSSTFQSEDIGIGPEYLSKDNRAWVINYWQVEIDEYPIMGTNVKINTWPYKFVKFLGHRNYELVGNDGKSLARADSLWALYDMKKMFPSVLSQEELELYKLEEPLDMEAKPRKIKVDGDFSKIGSFVIEKDRLDTNIHVNNAQYVKLACNYLPEDKIVNRLRVEYKQSMMLGMEVIVESLERDGLFYIRYVDKEGTVFATLEFGFK